MKYHDFRVNYKAANKSKANKISIGITNSNKLSSQNQVIIMSSNELL